MRDIIIARMNEIGYPITLPNKADIVSWRKPKFPMDRLARQSAWLTFLSSKGNIPLGHQLEALDDDALLALFERSVRNGITGRNNAKPELSKPVPRPVYEIPDPVQHDRFTAVVEFEIYDPTTNKYTIPDMGEVHAWLGENCDGRFLIVGTFVLFDHAGDATLCYLRFR